MRQAQHCKIAAREVTAAAFESPTHRYAAKIQRVPPLLPPKQEEAAAAKIALQKLQARASGAGEQQLERHRKQVRTLPGALPRRGRRCSRIHRHAAAESSACGL